MNAPVDFEAIKQARAALAELAKQHPELCQGSGSWADNLETLEEIMRTPGKTRMAEYRARQVSKGLKTISVFLTPEAQVALYRLQSERPESTMGEIISEALVCVLATKERQP